MPLTLTHCFFIILPNYACAHSNTQKDLTLNGNSTTTATSAYDSSAINSAMPAAQTDYQMPTSPAAAAPESNTSNVIEETRTNEDLDTEVSQINTQKTASEPVEYGESYSRPMSRTSTMTPVIKSFYCIY